MLSAKAGQEGMDVVPASDPDRHEEAEKNERHRYRREFPMNQVREGCADHGDPQYEDGKAGQTGHHQADRPHRLYDAHNIEKPAWVAPSYKVSDL